MAGYNISVYLDEPATWQTFKKACEIGGKRPNSVLRAFIERYSEQVLDELPLEHRIAKAMIEAQKIARGEIKGKDARDLLKEIEKE